MNIEVPVVIFEDNSSLHGVSTTNFREIEIVILEGDKAHVDFSDILPGSGINIGVGFVSRMRAIFVNLELMEVHGTYTGEETLPMACCKCNGITFYFPSCECIKE